MTRIDLCFECSAPNGKCQYAEAECISMDEFEASWTCEWLRATRKKEEKK